VWGLFTPPLLLATAFSYFNELLPLRSRQRLVCSLVTPAASLSSSEETAKGSEHTAPISSLQSQPLLDQVHRRSKSGVFSHPHYFSPPPSLTLTSCFRCAPKSRLVCSLVIMTPAASLSSSEEIATGSQVHRRWNTRVRVGSFHTPTTSRHHLLLL
jgi:hypothetical protein